MQLFGAESRRVNRATTPNGHCNTYRHLPFGLNAMVIAIVCVIQSNPAPRPRHSISSPYLFLIEMLVTVHTPPVCHCESDDPRLAISCCGRRPLPLPTAHPVLVICVWTRGGGDGERSKTRPSTSQSHTPLCHSEP